MTVENQVKFEPAENYVIDNLDALKILADPLRLRIMELLRKPGTVKQVAKGLDMTPTKLYYHIDKLEKKGLIVVVETRIVSGIIEKHYQTAAKQFTVDRNLISPGQPDSDESMDLTLSTLFEDAREDFFQSRKDGLIGMDEDTPEHRQAILSSSRMFLTEEQATTFYEKFGDLIREYAQFSREQVDDDGILAYKLMYFVFPSHHHRIQDEEDE